MTFRILLISVLVCSILSSCYKRSENCDAYDSGSGSTTVIRMNDGRMNNQSNGFGVVDGVVIAEHIPTKRMIPYEHVRESDGWQKDLDLKNSGILTAGEFNDLGNFELWNDLTENELNSQKNAWKFQYKHRYSVLVKSKFGCPLVNIPVSLISNEKPIWVAKTDSKGLAQLWLMDSTLTNLKVEVGQANSTENIENPKRFEDGINIISLNETNDENQEIDVVFAVDATGSMDDEIAFLKDDLLDVVMTIENGNNNVNLHLGSVFYQCYGSGNDYVTSSSDLTANISKTIEFIQTKKANGGGDEVVQIALDSAVNNMNWRSTASAKLLFILLDEPPSLSDSTSQKLQRVYEQAAKKGIKIIPCISSNSGYYQNRSLEYLMRNAAIATNGTLIFLTDDSGVGNSHTIPFKVEYEVETFKDILVRIINQSIEITPCQEQANPDSLVSETIELSNKSELIKSILDSIASLNTDTLIAQTILPFTHFSSEAELIKNMPISDIDSTEIIAHFNKEIQTLTVFPNPSYGNLTIRTSNPSDFTEVLDATGKLLLRNHTEERVEFQLDISDFPSGTYYLRTKIKDSILKATILKM